MADPTSATIADPLEAMPPAERVNYATGVLLDADDFRDEQTYHRARLARMLSALAGFGTLAGLRVIPPEAGDAELELHVAPGIAIDRYGRLIEIAEPWCIRLARWFAFQSTAQLRAAVHRAPRIALPVAVVVDVFLGALSCGRAKTPAFATGPFDALDAVVPARIAETASLELVARAEGGPGPIPTPRNFWPAAAASDEAHLQAVLDSWETGTAATAADGGLDPLAEHVAGHDTASVLLARVAIPVTLAADAPPEVRPQLDMTARVSVDNSIRPFIFMPGKWLGRAFTAEPLIRP
ncbi:MAG: hypothetical protein IT556_12270 [Acetobacteraceae bacterium]|nr:hypothetical protein [Acetobacteraceae bacterium]